MKVQLTRTKTNETFYIAKTYRDRKTGRSTSKIVRRLGTRSEIEGMLPPGTDVMGWAREEARRMTEQERGLTRKVTVSYDPARQIAPGERRASNVGYLFLQDIYSALGLDGICRDNNGQRNLRFFMRSASPLDRMQGLSRGARRTPASPLPARDLLWTYAGGSDCSTTRLNSCALCLVVDASERRLW
jgi:hypothetical protein